MEKSLNIKIKIDADGKSLKIVSDGLSNIGVSANKTGSAISKVGSGINTLKDRIDVIAHSTQAMTGIGTIIGKIASAVSSQITSAIDLTSKQEQLNLSLTSLINISHESVSVTGKMVDMNQKWALDS